MAQYHISENGEPNLCDAKIKCRLGGESGKENHFDTADEARMAYESKMKEATVAPRNSRNKKFAVSKDDIIQEGQFKGLVKPEFLFKQDIPAHVEDKVIYTDFSKIYREINKNQADIYSELRSRGISLHLDAKAYSNEATKAFKELDKAGLAEHLRNRKNIALSFIENAGRDKRTVKEIIESGENIDKDLSSYNLKNYQSRAINNFARAITYAKPKLKEKAYNLPVKYVDTFVGEKDVELGNADHLIEIASEVHAKHPDFDPRAKVSRPHDLGGSGNIGTREHFRASIQKIGRDTAASNMTEQYVIDKFGVDGAKDFWNKKFHSDTNNRPTLPKFMKLVKDFEKERNS